MIELRTLGGLDLLLLDGGSPRAVSLQAKRLALLAYLATSPEHTGRRRDTVLALFWPELDQEHARGALRQALHAIRRALGEGVIVTRGEEQVAIDPAMLTSDVARLQSAIGEGKPEAALELYRGAFLEGVFVADTGEALEDWIGAERLRIRALAARAAWMAAERPDAEAEVGEFVRRAVLLSGDDESALRRGIGRLEERGDRAGAAALFEGFSRRAARDLDIELSPATRQAMEALRARRAPEEHAVTPRAAVADAIAPSEPASPTRTRRRALIAPAAGVALSVVLVAYLASDRATSSSPPSPDLVAVLPFHVAAADSSLTWLGTGMVELLTIRIAHDEGPDFVDPSRVIAKWQRIRGGSGAEVAARLGAGRLIDGSIARVGERVTLTGRLARTDGAERVAQASVEGHADSLVQLVDRLAVQLLGLSAGVDQARLASLTSTSMPAVRAYLRGQDAFRDGRMTLAVQAFREATTLDTTFALAGLRLGRATKWGGRSEEGERGIRIALRGRERLSQADRVLLDAMAAPTSSASAMFADWDAAVIALPDSPELWYTLGDHHFHWGKLAGEEDANERASVAFRRGWRLDSMQVTSGAKAWLPEPAQHMLALAHVAHDTAAVLQLADVVIRADSTSDVAQLAMWHRAAVSGVAARHTYRAQVSSASDEVVKNITLFIVWTGQETDDLAWIAAEDRRRLKAHDPGWATFAFTIKAHNAGRPSDAPRVSPAPGHAGHRALRAQLRRAMWWGGDSTGGLRAAAVLQALADSAPVQGPGARQQFYDLCTVGTWRAARGDHRYAASASERLRNARPTGLALIDSAAFGRYATLCSTLLRAMHASETRARAARAAVAEADSLAREFIFEVCCGDAVQDANLHLVRLWEREGETRRALSAARRGAGGVGIAPLYLSTFLAEEGRLALVTGDTAGAVRAYRHYLALRPDPEPRFAPEVDRIRRELAAITRR